MTTSPYQEERFGVAMNFSYEIHFDLSLEIVWIDNIK